MENQLSIKFTAKSWLDLLNDPWKDDPTVVVYMVPSDTAFKLNDATDPQLKGMKMATADFKRDEKEYRIPLQLTDRDYGNYVQQKKVVEALGGRMHPVAYVGKLSGIPTKCTAPKQDFMPIVLNHDKPHTQMLHFRDFFANLTKKVEING